MRTVALSKEKVAYSRSVDSEEGRLAEQLGHLLRAGQWRDRIGGVTDEQEREAGVGTNPRT